MKHISNRYIAFLLAAVTVMPSCANDSIGDGDGNGDALDDAVSQTAFTGTCDPSRAIGAVPGFQRALLDTIATTEGTYHAGGDDGYNVAFGFHYFGDCTRHPGVVYCSGSLCSDASGRYQFLSTTWNGLGLSTFYPNNQDRGAMVLIARRGGSVPTNRALTNGEFVNVMNLISYEWASLPPGRYGQPSVTMAKAWSIYAGFASKVNSGPPPAVPPLPTACGTIDPGHGLSRGHAQSSCDHRFSLAMQNDGNLVLYQGTKPLWATSTNGRGGSVAVMQTDGNFVLYDDRSVALFSTRTNGHGGAGAVVQTDGNFVVYGGTKPLWATNTCCR
jgi:muramidase (phage lysozyme)